MKRDFDRISEELELALLKNGQVSRQRTQEAEESSHILLATHKCFCHLALDYILQINAFEMQKEFKVVNTVLSYLNAENTFFHQGYDLLIDLDPLLKNMATQLDQMSTDYLNRQKALEQRHLSLLQQDNATDIGAEYLSRAPAGVAIEGYLYKRASRTSKTWNRGWFSVQRNQLLYQKEWKGEAVPVMEDLRLCAVRPLDDLERRHCFEIFSVHTNCVLQADSQPMRQAWIQAVKASIDSAYREAAESESTAESSEGSATPSKGREGVRKGPGVLQQLTRVPGNDQCCDCGRASPRWASINLGITLCIECSGIHRSLGVHRSKVRSLTLDSWEPESLKMLTELGNKVINRIYEAGREETGMNKAAADSSQQQKELWIKAKYVERKFLKELCSGTGITGDSTDQLGDSLPASQELCLYRAASVGDLPAMCEAVASGAGVNWTNSEDENRTPLIAAARGGFLTACEFLLQNGANVNFRDARGQGAIHAATRAGHTGPVCLLLKRGANQYAVDEIGHDPLSVAVATANADIVTLLRLARMNEEMRDAEGVFGYTGDDETFQDIFRDFSRMASDDPEKLSRRRFDGGRGAEQCPSVNRGGPSRGAEGLSRGADSAVGGGAGSKEERDTPSTAL
ncbi:arf-GAP with coiled-coil, ANK repeat and PH domain-containing protein 2-like isoform X2 [Heterodontus francisci]|uniref:arf-GAP with coiled-coil, ANK repeat and PH domain-containing protein 2-like isoform X2 n=1 Tax=Heterodontus francisci TaxID=7792 RepID=UPI00355B6D3B